MGDIRPTPVSHGVQAPQYFKYNTVCIDQYGQVFYKKDLPGDWFSYLEIKTNLTPADFANPLYFRTKGAILSWVLRVRRLSGT